MQELLALMQAERGFEEASLTRPFDANAIKQRKGNFGRMIDYIEGTKIIQRLNEATGNRWSCRVESTQKVKAESRVDPKTGEVYEYPSYWAVVITITIPSMGARSQVGTKPITGNEEDDLKAAVTDGIKKAATLFGIALDLYDDDQGANSGQANGGQSAARSGRRQAAKSSGDGGNAGHAGAITPTQKNAILSIGRSNQLTEGQLIDMVAAEFGVDTLDQLSKPQASQFIQSLQRLT